MTIGKDPTITVCRRRSDNVWLPCHVNAAPLWKCLPTVTMSNKASHISRIVCDCPSCFCLCLDATKVCVELYTFFKEMKGHKLLSVSELLHYQTQDSCFRENEDMGFNRGHLNTWKSHVKMFNSCTHKHHLKLSLNSKRGSSKNRNKELVSTQNS